MVDSSITLGFYIYTYTYMYMYICVCVCARACMKESLGLEKKIKTSESLGLEKEDNDLKGPC